MGILDNYSDEALKKIVDGCISFRELSGKLGYKARGKNNETIKKRLKESGISTEHFTGLPRNVVNRTLGNTFITNSTVSQCVLRRMYMAGGYSEYKCAICGQGSVWNGKPLGLTLDHINGINNDNRIENLRWVCPNCDRQLDTYAGRNLKGKTSALRERYKKHRKELEPPNFCKSCGKPISPKARLCLDCYKKVPKSKAKPAKEVLVRIIRENNGNFLRIGKKLGVTDNAVRKWCKGYGLPYHSKDYKIKNTGDSLN